jgi:NADH-quinone oxidoreductase E subunit
MTAAPVSNVAEPTSFVFNADNLAKAKAFVAKYPEGRQASAVLPLLDLAQRQSGGWLPRVAIEYVADFLAMPYMRVLEVVTFYTMFKQQPVGKYLLQICTTTPCWLRGSDAVVKACRDKLGIDFNQTTKNGLFTMEEVECLGACVNAPMIQVNDWFVEDLDADRTTALLDALNRGEDVPIGSQIGRQGSAPEGMLTASSQAGDSQAKPAEPVGKTGSASKKPASPKAAPKTSAKPSAKTTPQNPS